MLYQLVHWWHWLAYGQNAAVVGALGTVVAALAATAAGVFAAHAYKATLSQLQIAREQLSLAHAQFDSERNRFEEELRIRAIAERARFDRMSAEEEATRPRFRMMNGYQPLGGMQRWEFKNFGTSAATEVSVSLRDGGGPLAKEGIVGVGAAIAFLCTPWDLEKEGLLFRFKTEFGSRWCIIVRLNGSEEIESVTRIYAPEATSD